MFENLFSLLFCCPSNKDSMQKVGLLTVGRLLIFLMYVIIFANLYVYLKLSVYSFLTFKSMIFTISYTLLIVYVVYCIMFFHYHACFTIPGYPEKVTMKQTSQKPLSKELTQDFSPFLKNLMSHRGKGYLSLLHGNIGYKTTCEKCPGSPIKPLRTHHCSTCNRDILFMDHHCYLINNCIGLQNRRFFILFVTYLAVASSLMIYPLTITQKPDSMNDEVLLNFVMAKNFIISIILIIFSVWNWVLVAQGQTVIEFMQNRDPNEDQFIYELPSCRENLFVSFGTSSICELILPIQRELLVNGLEWTFVNFSQEGENEKLIR